MRLSIGVTILSWTTTPMTVLWILSWRERTYGQERTCQDLKSVCQIIIVAYDHSVECWQAMWHSRLVWKKTSLTRTLRILGAVLSLRITHPKHPLASISALTRTAIVNVRITISQIFSAGRYAINTMYSLHRPGSWRSSRSGGSKQTRRMGVSTPKERQFYHQHRWSATVV